MYPSGKQTSAAETVNRLCELGCRSLKTNPISNVGAWKEGGYGESISMDELYRLYLDYIPLYYADGMPLSLQLGGFFSASPKRPEEYDIPSAKRCAAPEKTCVCGHARMVMYISAEGRALPCMALSGMEIQQEFPLITEIGLAACRASALETHPDDILAPDPAACALFRGRWAEKIDAAMKALGPQYRRN